MRTPNSLEKRHLASLKSLREHDDIHLAEERRTKIGPSFSELVPFSKFEREWNDLYLDPDAFEGALRFAIGASWDFSASGEELAGEYSIPSPLEIMMQHASPLARSLKDPFQRAFAAQLRAMDSDAFAGGGFTTYVRMDPTTPHQEIWFNELVGIGGPPHPYGFVKLNLSYKKYLEILVLTKGIYGWQYLFSDISFSDSAIRHHREGLSRGLQVFPDMFPDHDFTELQQRLEARL